MANDLIRLVHTVTKVIDGCGCCGELKKGDTVKISLDGTSPLWPEFFLAEVEDVAKAPKGRVYKYLFDRELLGGGPIPHECNVKVDCYSELDELRDRLKVLEDCLATSGDELNCDGLPQIQY